MKKIKFLIKLIVFLCIFSFAFISVSYIARPKSEMKTRFAGFYSEPKDTLDVVVIGSSPVSPLLAAPYIWNEFGITTYPLSTNAQPVTVIKYIIAEAQKSQSDSLYIVDVSMYMVGVDVLLTEPRIRNVVDNMKYSATRIRAINDMVKDKSDRIDYYFDISKYHSAIVGEDGIKKEDIKYFGFSSNSKYKGYLFVDAVDIFKQVDISSVTKEKPIPTDAEQELVVLMDYCKENELDVLFVVCPYVATQDKKMQHNYLENLIVDYGYSFIDFNDLYSELELDFGKDFYNVNHMNIYGAEKFSRYLGAYLQSNYSFEDKRGDESYSSWDDAYMAWDKEAIITKENIDKNIELLTNR